MATLPPLTLSERPIDRLLTPFQNFLRVEAAGGILLIVATVVALVWANSPWQESYHRLWGTTVTAGVGGLVISKPLELWVNDGLMAVFFFVVGLEIKREMLVGELASPRKAAVPIAAAVGGMVVPAVIYAVVNRGTDGMSGWAIPTATDIGFALGVMALLGKRVPLALKIFVTAAAIVDDIGAVLVIAIFYSKGISTVALAAALAVLALLVLANLLHVRRPVVYAVLGLILWVAVLKSGVHATIAGVLLAFTIPSKFRIRGATFVAFARNALEDYEEAGGNQDDILTNPIRQKLVYGIELACEHVLTPMQRLEHVLHRWSSFLILPVFALANAGVSFGAGPGVGAAVTSRIGLGIILGLLIGKQVGIALFAALAIRLNLGDLPARTTWRQLYAASWLAGIGFTMSLFIASLGFGPGDRLYTAKIAIFTASVIAGIGGYALLRLWSPPPAPDEDDET